MGDHEKLCHGKDVFERMNYLFQASQMLSKVDRVAGSLCGNMMVTCARKSVLRIETNLKRSICRSCQSPLTPGETARVRLVTKPVKAVQWTCLLCNTVKRIPTKRGYKLWSDDPNSVVKIFDYSPKSSGPQVPQEICNSSKVKTKTNDKAKSSQNSSSAEDVNQTGDKG